MTGNHLLADWQPSPTPISPVQLFGGVLNPSLAYNDAGIGLLLGFDVTTSLTSAFRFNGSTWDPPVSLIPGTSFGTSVALNLTSGLAVYNPFTTGFDIRASRYDVTTNSWFDTGGSSIQLSSTGSSPFVAISPQGNGLATFTISGVAFASQYDSLTMTWSDTGLSAVQLSTTGDTVQDKAKIAMDANSNGLAVWNNLLGSGNYVQASNYNGTTKVWTNTQASAINLSLNDVTGGNNCNVAMSPIGTGLAVWVADPGSGQVVESSWYNGASWQFTGASAKIVSANGAVGIPLSVTMDDAGNGFTIWSLFDGTNYVTQAARFDGTNQTWGTPVTLSTTGVFISNLAISASGSGNALAGWVLNDGMESIAQSSFYNNATQSWENTINQASILSDPSESANDLFIVMNDQNNGLAYFGQGAYPFLGAFSNFYTYTAPPIIIPINGTNFIGVKQKNKFLTQTDNIRILTWTASVDPSVVGYYVRADGFIIANVVASSPLEVILHNQNPKIPTTYTLTAYDASNVESAPLNFTIK